MSQDDPANDNDLDEHDAHYLGLVDTLPMMPAAEPKRPTPEGSH